MRLVIDIVKLSADSLKQFPAYPAIGGAVGVNQSDPAGAANLEKVDHVVVLMLENRSFDHMLGYLSLMGARPEIDGLRPGLANQDQGRTYPVHHLAGTALEMDPDHSASAIDQQVAGGSMTGFVASAAAAGTLRQVSWIDPAFTNFNLLGFPVNDDHPPADIKDGQDLVLAVYDALAASPQWDRSLLVIVYDENGGFYDHVPPPRAADDEPEMFGKYGVRVPAIIVSPWIEPRTVSHTLFDHTSIIKTILSRFCPKALNQPQQPKGRHASPGLKPQHPGLRVAQANHLGELLTRTTPRPAPLRDTLLQQAVARGAQMETRQPRPGRRGEGEYPLNDLQKSILAATGQLRSAGHPSNAP
jgi:phospholipase C